MERGKLVDEVRDLRRYKRERERTNKRRSIRVEKRSSWMVVVREREREKLFRDHDSGREREKITSWSNGDINATRREEREKERDLFIRSSYKSREVREREMLAVLFMVGVGYLTVERGERERERERHVS